MSTEADEDIEAMDVALETMRADIEGGGLGMEGDEMFHAAITRSARSPLLADFMDALAPAITETRLSSLSEPLRPPRSLAAHERIADAVRKQDANAARTAMRRHLEMVADVGLLRWRAAAEAEAEVDHASAHPRFSQPGQPRTTATSS